MSGDSNFIARWSRLKRRAADEKRTPRPGTVVEDSRAAGADAGEQAEAKRPQADVPAKPLDADPPFDPASLPPIESIVAGTDIRAFLQKGVPAALKRAALRRAWSTEPAIRDFIEVAENQWDFTDPTAIPGFGPLEATDNVRQLVDQGLGKLPEPAPDAPQAAGHAPERPTSIAASQATGEAATCKAPVEPTRHTQRVDVREEPDNPDTGGVAALQHSGFSTATGNVPRRKGHGSALPKVPP